MLRWDRLRGSDRSPLDGTDPSELKEIPSFRPPGRGFSENCLTVDFNLKSLWPERRPVLTPSSLPSFDFFDLIEYYAFRLTLFISFIWTLVQILKHKFRG
jgi:hypothetical protein